MFVVESLSKFFFVVVKQVDGCLLRNSPGSTIYSDEFLQQIDADVLKRSVPITKEGKCVYKCMLRSVGMVSRQFESLKLSNCIAENMISIIGETWCY